jgi:hypothetical protein
MFKPIDDSTPEGWGNFFLIRPVGNWQDGPKKFHPTIVQRVEGKFYTSMNELDPIYFGQDESPGDPGYSELEWAPMPVEWEC